MQDPVFNRIESQPRPSLSAASGLVLLAVVGLWVSTLAELALPVGNAMTLINLLYYLPFIALPLAVALHRRPGLSEALRLNPLPALPTLTLALLALLSAYVASGLTAAWGIGLDALGLHSAGTVALPQSRGEMALAIIMMAALPAVCEELLFRGFALAAWESRGTAFAIGVTSALFALLHGNLYGLPAYLLVGAVAGFATFALNTVYAGIAYHTIYNAACLIIPWMLGADAEVQAAADGATAFSIALEVIMMACMMAMLMASLRLRARRMGVEPIPRIRRPLSPRDRATLLAAVAAMLTTNAAVLALASRLAAGSGGAP